MHGRDREDPGAQGVRVAGDHARSRRPVRGRARRRNALHDVPLPPAHLVAFGTGLLAERRHPLPLRWSDPSRRVAGLTAVAAGSALAARSVAVATGVRLADPAHLVVTGPYALTRNPMYLAWAVLHLGVAILTRSGWTLALLPVAAAVVDREVRAEERLLGDRFGDEYTQYRATVPRYVGRRRGRVPVVRPAPGRTGTGLLPSRPTAAVVRTSGPGRAGCSGSRGRSWWGRTPS